ncbi:DNA-binding Lrp family transcriptional regulator [Nakamurella sp. UYEF19]|uniref:Lrp/AsnC family transcriptional regulator n=1 Tax=Nakamurella sp. UYEF19 TaxID=1756392 RepID=UPI003392D76F
MKQSVPSDIGIVDDLDRKILQALQINGRAAFSLIGEVVGVSEQTVARRYRRLREQGVVRVVGLVDPTRLGQLDWMVRITCRPDASGALAAALARRDDVAWVSLTGAGNEIVASLRARTQDAREELLLRRLPKTEQVLDLAAAIVMHRFTGLYDNDWQAYRGGLGDQAVAALAHARGGQPDTVQPDARPSEPSEITSGATVPAAPLLPEDQPLLAALARDGRTPISVLAKASGWSQGRTRRRLDTLIDDGALYLDVDLFMPALGFPLMAMLWMTVEPQHLDAFGNALVKESAVTFAGAITGSSNISAAVALTEVDSLYRFVNRVGDLAPGLRQLEIAPVITRIKQAGSLVIGDRLGEPRPASGR